MKVIFRFMFYKTKDQWTRAESNRRPNTFAVNFLHVYPLHCCCGRKGLTKRRSASTIRLWTGNYIKIDLVTFCCQAVTAPLQLSRLGWLNTEHVDNRSFACIIIHVHNTTSFCCIVVYFFRIQIKQLITQRCTCLHLQRTMLSKPVGPGLKRGADWKDTPGESKNN